MQFRPLSSPRLCGILYQAVKLTPQGGVTFMFNFLLETREEQNKILLQNFLKFPQDTLGLVFSNQRSPFSSQFSTDPNLFPKSTFLRKVTLVSPVKTLLLQLVLVPGMSLSAGHPVPVFSFATSSPDLFFKDPRKPSGLTSCAFC